MSIGEHDLVQVATDHFHTRYGVEPTIAASAPGRISVIGGHIDHCHGPVLPMAITRRTVLVGRPNGTSTVRFSTDGGLPDFEFEISPKILEPTHAKATPFWSNYIIGVFAQFPRNIQGLDVVVHSDIPMGGGLSSSAALEVATYTLLEALTGDTSRTAVDKALQCMKAENDWANVPCGCMDQTCSTMGQAGTLLLVDCLTMGITRIPLYHGVCFLVADSGHKHKLEGSEFKNRKDQAADVKAIVRKTFPDVQSHQDITPEMLEAVRKDMPDTTYRIGVHVLTEIKRVHRFAEIMVEIETECSAADSDTHTSDTIEAKLRQAGQLMFEAHNSSANNYCVSTPELNELIEIARKVPGVYGSRLTGGGFGGCTVNMVDKNCVGALEKAIREQYSGNATVFTTEAGEGAKVEQFPSKSR